MIFPDIYDEKGNFILDKENFPDTSSVKRVCNTLLNYQSFDEFCLQIERSKDIQIIVDRFDKMILIVNKKNSENIGKIYLSNFTADTFFGKSHLYKKVHSSYIGKGFGEILMKLYEKKSLEDEAFVFPDIDYTQKASVIHLYKKFGFEIVGKINNSKIVAITDIEKEQIETQIGEYQNGKREKAFDFIVVLQRKSL